MSTSMCKTSVGRIYQEVIDEVINGARYLFMEDGIEEQVLHELKHMWETKLKTSKAVVNEQELPKKPPPEPTPSNTNNTTSTSTASNGFPKVPPPTLEVIPKMVPIQITLPAQPGSDAQPKVLTIQVPTTALQNNQLQKVLTGQIITATMNLPPATASNMLQQHVNQVFKTQVQTMQTAPSSFNSNYKPVGAVPPIQQNSMMGASSSSSTATSLSSTQMSSNSSTMPLTMAQQTDGACDFVALEESDNCKKDLIEIEIILPKRRRCNNAHKRIKPPSTILHSLDGTNVDTSDDDEDNSDEQNDDDDDADDDKDDEDQEMQEELQEEDPLNSDDDVTDDDPTDLFDTDNIVVCQYDKIIRNRNKWKFYLKDGIMNLTGYDYVFQKATGEAEW